MLKKKLTSIVLAIAMLMSLSAVSVSASNTDAISAVKLDTTSFTQVSNQYNKMTQSTYNLGGVSVWGDTAAEEKLPGDANGALHFNIGDKGITDVSRFLMWSVTPNAEDPTAAPASNARFDIAAATVPTYWSVDVYDNGAITKIEMKAGAYPMNTAVTADQLTDNAWNTLAVVHYPNAKNSAQMGTVDFYLNGEYVSTKDMSAVSTATTQTRFQFNFTDAEANAYFDNVKIYEMTSFTRPAVASTDDITVADKVISNYGNTTVVALESTLGVEILTAEGTAAADDAKVVSGMKAVASNTITGVGTFTDEYTFGADGTTGVRAVKIDATGYAVYKDQYNRLIASGYNYTLVGNDIATGIGDDSNGCLPIKVGSKGIVDQSRILMNENTLGADGKVASYSQYHIANTKVPVYWSVDVYDNNAISRITMQAGGLALHTAITADQLTDNIWNTVAVAYYPNTEDETKLGYADLYINGKFIETKDVSNSAVASYSQTRFGYYFNNADATAYFDNFKIYEMNSFVRPDIKAGVDVVGGKITGYLTSTVGELETATGANIVTASGADADANATAVPGMKAVVSGEVEGVGTFVNEYELGSSDKVLVSEDFTSSTEYKNVLNDAIGFTHAVENGALKITTASQDDFTDGTMDARFALKPGGTLITPGSGDPLVYSIDFKPSAGMRALRFDTSGQKWSDEIPASKFNIGEWNSVKLVFYKTAIQFSEGWESDVYINNKLVSRGYRNSSPNLGAALRFHIVTEATGDVHYIDNIEVKSSTGFVRPEFSSEAYAVLGGSGMTAAIINGYKDMKVESIKSGADKADGVTVEVYNADGTVAEATKVVEQGMYAVATRGDYSYRYDFDVADYRIGTWECTVDGTAVSGDTCAAGKLVAKLPVENYVVGGSVSFNVIIAEYDSNNRFVNATFIPAASTAVDGYGQAEFTLTKGNTYKIFAWESMDTLTPFLRTVKTLTVE